MKKVSITREYLNIRTKDKKRQLIVYEEDGNPGIWYKGYAKDFLPQDKELTAQEILDDAN